MSGIGPPTHENQQPTRWFQRETEKMHRTSILAAIVLAIGVAAPAAAQEPVKWAGGYAGLNAGHAWGNVDVRDTTGGVTPGPFSYDASGFFGGGTLGYNWQAGNLVYGLEGDLGYMDLTGAGIIPSSVPTAHQDITLRGGVYGDITGRLGLAWGRSLFYAKGGAAFLAGEATQTTTNPGYVTHGTGNFTGWVAGGGIEHFITPSLSLKAEYLHFDFGSRPGDQTSITDAPVGYVYRNTTDLTADTVKVGMAWHF
jgi:outer membrane immunogenic protein